MKISRQLHRPRRERIWESLRILALPLFLLGFLCAVMAAAQFSINRQANGEVTVSMPALPGIDAAFLRMNIPFTMDITTAASVARAFRPKIVFPSHYRNQDSTYADLAAFKQLVGTDLGIEVRTRAWY